MEYQILLSRKAEKNLYKINQPFQKRTLNLINKLKKSPYLGKALLGRLKGLCSLRIWPFRLIYEIDSKHKKITILVIAHRQKVYKMVKN